MADNLPQSVHLAIADAVEKGELHLIKNNQYSIEKYNHSKRVYSVGNMWFPIAWKQVDGIWLSEVAGVLLWDDGK